MTNRSKRDKKQESRKDHALTKKGRRFMREESYLKKLSNQERMAYEECMALVQTIGQNGSLEDACEWLEKYAADKKE